MELPENNGRMFCPVAAISLRNFHNPQKYVVGPPNNLRVDEVTTALKKDGSLPLIWFQVKNWCVKLTSCSLPSALESVHPKYILNSLDKQGVLYGWYVQWWRDTNPFANNFIRVIVSFSGFSATVKNRIKNYNQNHQAQPIILWQPNKKLLGKLEGNANLQPNSVQKSNKIDRKRVDDSYLVIQPLDVYLPNPNNNNNPPLQQKPRKRSRSNSDENQRTLEGMWVSATPTGQKTTTDTDMVTLGEDWINFSLNK